MSLFSGCGGLDLGFKASGYELLYACDTDPAAVDCYARNIDGRVHQRAVESPQFRRDLESLGSCDVVLGGFPCQGFSKAGPKAANDARNRLYLEMKKAVEVLHPQVFIAENVDGISQNFNGEYLRRILRDFKAIGYSVEHRILDAIAYGLPQFRRRIFFVGLSESLGQVFAWPCTSHRPLIRNGEFRVSHDRPLWDPPGPLFVSPTVRICDVIGDLLELDSGVPDHRVANNWPRKYAAVFRAIGPGQKLCNVRHADTSVYTWQVPEVFGRTTQRERLVLETIARHRRHKKYGDIPNGNPLPSLEIARLSGLDDVTNEITALLAKGYLKKKGDAYDLKGAMFCSGLFKRPRWDEPSPTVLTNFHNPRYFLHPLRDRPFSLRECARLQGFPDTFLFTDGSTKVGLVDGYRLVGNAVPPALSKRLAEAVLEVLPVPRERCQRTHEAAV